MQQLIKVGLLAIVFACTGQAAAGDGKMLMMKNGCIACHKVEGKMVGPAYKEVAARYKGEEGAKQQLVQSVLNGGVDKWGKIPMPPKGGRTTLKEEDVDELVSWILTL